MRATCALFWVVEKLCAHSAHFFGWAPPLNWELLVYKIPYRLARAWPSGFRPSASREQRYFAYKGAPRSIPGNDT